MRDVMTDWTKLSPLPMVNRKHGYELSFYGVRDRYEALPKEPLLIRGELLSPYVPAEPDGAVHLDAILGSMVLDSHPVPHHRNEEACVVPLPVELAWVSPEGLPLWTVSDLRPQGDVLRDTSYWHKRYPEDRADLATKVRAETRRGRYKEYRVPLSTIDVPEVRAVCIGDASEVARLLSECSHVGKKASQGFGRVSWRVTRWEENSTTAREAALMARPVPARYLLEEKGEIKLSEGSSYSRRSWCPPHWFSPWHDLAVVRA